MLPRHGVHRYERWLSQPGLGPGEFVIEDVLANVVLQFRYAVLMVVWYWHWLRAFAVSSAALVALFWWCLTRWKGNWTTPPKGGGLNYVAGWWLGAMCAAPLVVIVSFIGNVLEESASRLELQVLIADELGADLLASPYRGSLPSSLLAERAVGRTQSEVRHMTRHALKRFHTRCAQPAKESCSAEIFTYFSHDYLIRQTLVVCYDGLVAVSAYVDTDSGGVGCGSS